MQKDIIHANRKLFSGLHFLKMVLCECFVGWIFNRYGKKPRQQWHQHSYVRHLKSTLLPWWLKTRICASHLSASLDKGEGPLDYKTQMGYPGAAEEGGRRDLIRKVWAKMGESRSQEVRDFGLTFSKTSFSFDPTVTLPIYGWSEAPLPQLRAGAEQSFVTGLFP